MIISVTASMIRSAVRGEFAEWDAVENVGDRGWTGGE
jgi:hypothetical protein